MTREEAIQYILDSDDNAGFFVVSITAEDLASKLGEWSYKEFTSRCPLEQVKALSRTADLLHTEYEEEIFDKSLILAFFEADSLEDGEESYND